MSSLPGVVFSALRHSAGLRSPRPVMGGSRPGIRNSDRQPRRENPRQPDTTRLNHSDLWTAPYRAVISRWDMPVMCRSAAVAKTDYADRTTTSGARATTQTDRSPVRARLSAKPASRRCWRPSTEVVHHMGRVHWSAGISGRAGSTDQHRPER